MSIEENKNVANGSVKRHKKNDNFTILSNDCFLDKPPLSLEAKGLLCQMFSLPDSWNHSIEGYRKLCGVGERKIKNLFKELKERGYLKIEQIPPRYSASGRFAYIYHIYDEKQDFSTDLPKGQNEPTVQNSPTVPGGQNVPSGASAGVVNEPLNKELSNKELKDINKINNNKELKSSFGEFNNVFLTQKEQEKLSALYGNKFSEAVEVLSSYKASKDKKYKSDYAVLGEHNWVFKKIFPNGKPQTQSEQHSQGSKYAKCYETGVC